MNEAERQELRDEVDRKRREKAGLPQRNEEIRTTFLHSRETAGTWVFEEVEHPMLLGKVYVNKRAILALGEPDRIEVVIRPL